MVWCSGVAVYGVSVYGVWCMVSTCQVADRSALPAVVDGGSVGERSTLAGVHLAVVATHHSLPRAVTLKHSSTV